QNLLFGRRQLGGLGECPFEQCRHGNGPSPGALYRPGRGPTTTSRPDARAVTRLSNIRIRSARFTEPPTRRLCGRRVVRRSSDPDRSRPGPAEETFRIVPPISGGGNQARYAASICSQIWTSAASRSAARSLFSGRPGSFAAWKSLSSVAVYRLE